MGISPDDNYIKTITEEFQIKMRETEEEFMYELIRPYSEKIIEKRLSKEELKRILLLGLNSDAQIKSWLSSFNTESATCCFTAVQQLKEKLNGQMD